MRRFALLFLSLLLAVTANAAITRVQFVTATTGASQPASLTFTPAAVTAGNYVMIFVARNDSQDLKVVPGGSEKDWLGGRIATANLGASSPVCYILFYKVVTGGQTSVVISSQAGSGAAMSGVLVEYSGKNIVPDVWALPKTGTSTTPNTNVTDTTTSPNDLIVSALAQRGAFASEQTAWASSPTNSFSIVAQTSTFINTTNNDRAIAALERFATATGTFSTGVTISVSQQFTACIVAFREVPQVASNIGGL
jgi:hypothetical protein